MNNEKNLFQKMILSTFILGGIGFFGNFQVVFMMILVLVCFFCSVGKIKFNACTFAMIFFLFSYTIIIYSYLVVANDHFYLNRMLGQLIKFILVVLSIMWGYSAKDLSLDSLNKIIRIFLMFNVFLGVVQILLFYSNVPYWGISYNRNFVDVDSLIFGFRVNGLSGEPKSYGVVMVWSFFFFLHSFKRKANMLDLVLFLTSFIFILSTSSGNAFLALFIGLFLFYFKYFNFRFILKLFAVFLVLIYLVVDFKDVIFSRPSHLMLINKLLSLSFDIRFFDDLILLPVATFFEYPMFIFFGFGVGALHFFAIDSLYLASWFNLDSGYIVGGLGFIENISNWGLIPFCTICFYLMKRLFDNHNTFFPLVLISMTSLFVGSMEIIPTFFIVGVILRPEINSRYDER